MLSVYTPASYAANIGTTVFAIPWPYQDPSHVKPYLDGVLLTSGFSVSPAGASGTVTFTVAPSGTNITFNRELPIDQITDFQNQGSFVGKRHEDTYDRELMQIAQVKERLDRAVVAAVGKPGQVLPTPSANKPIGWDSGGTVLTNIDPGSIPLAVPASQSVDQSKLAVDVQYRVNTIADLKALVTKYNVVLVLGYYAAGDGGGGLFRWNSADVTADNLGTVIIPNAGGTGRWNRVFEGTLYASWFGTKGDGVTDDTTTINNALTAAGDGGTVTLGKYNFYCASTIVVPAGRTLIGSALSNGTSGNPGNSNQTQASRPINIISNAATAITLAAGSALKFVSFIKNGVTFSQSNVSNFANTGIQIVGDDVTVAECAVYGFNQGVYASDYQRMKILSVIGDCVNGVWLNRVFDIATVEKCHFWPYVTISSGEPNSTRTGIAFYLSEVADWCRLDKCFAYGYLTSFRLKAVAQVRVSNCGADCSASLAGTRTGFKVETGTAGTSDIVITDCIASFQTYGMDITAPSGEYVLVKGMTIFNVPASAYGIRVNGGSAIITGCSIAGSGASAIGISLPTETYGSIVADVVFRLTSGTSTCVSNAHTEHIHQLRTLTQYGSSALYSSASALEPQLISPSANVLTLPTFNRNTDTYVVNNSVSSAFTSIASNNKIPGQVITLIFNSAITITSSANITVKSSPAVTAAGSVMSFVYKGSDYWIEVSRNF